MVESLFTNLTKGDEAPPSYVDGKNFSKDLLQDLITKYGSPSPELDLSVFGALTTLALSVYATNSKLDAEKILRASCAVAHAYYSDLTAANEDLSDED